MSGAYHGQGEGTGVNPPTSDSAVRRRSTDYTPPAARMAEAAALLLRDPNVMCHALIAALDAIKGEGPRNVIINHLAKEAAK